MKQIVKMVLLSCCIFSFLMVNGCSKKEENKKEQITEEPKEKTQLIENQQYTSPLNPTENQILAYNDLSAAVEKKIIKKRQNRLRLVLFMIFSHCRIKNLLKILAGCNLFQVIR